MFSVPPSPPHSHNAQQGQMIQLCPVSHDNVTQRSLDINSQIDISPPHAIQCNQQYQQILPSPPLILTQPQPNFQFNSPINISKHHNIQFIQRYQQKSPLTKSNEKNYFSIFIYNIDYTVSYQELHNFCSKAGEISQLVYNSFNKGNAFCIFYDLRSAADAIQNLNSQSLKIRILFIEYASVQSISSFRSYYDTYSKAIIKSSKSKSSLTTDDINEVMSQFGEIKSCTQKTRKSRHIIKYLIEYFDFRAAQKCIEIEKMHFKDEDLNSSFKIEKNTSSYNDFINILKIDNKDEMEKKIEKVSRFHNPKPISDRKILIYLRIYSKSQIRIRFGVGENRIDRIERQMKYGIRRKTTRVFKI